jgi:butyryl-CoA dehydrogenase
VSTGLQCLGGYGYCDEYPLEQFYRDARIHPIHEGTTGIQGLDLLGRKIPMHNGKAFQLFLEEVGKAIAAARAMPGLEARAAELEEAVEKLKKVTAHLVGVAMKGNIELFLADATLYLEFLGLIAVGWQWLVQATAAQRALEGDSGGADVHFYRGKLYAFRYYFGYELPKIEGLICRLMDTDGLTVEMTEEFFKD